MSSGMREGEAKAGPLALASLCSGLRVRAGAGSVNVGLLRVPVATLGCWEQDPAQLCH